MVDVQDAATAGLRVHFAKKAELPARQIESAESFIDTLDKLAAAGQKPDATTVADGKALLKTLDDKTQLFMFNAAVLAGQEAATDKELDRKIAKISEGLERAQDTSDRLRQTLARFSQNR
jgi:hypothetical protein